MVRDYQSKRQIKLEMHTKQSSSESNGQLRKPILLIYCFCLLSKFKEWCGVKKVSKFSQSLILFPSPEGLIQNKVIFALKLLENMLLSAVLIS